MISCFLRSRRLWGVGWMVVCAAGLGLAASAQAAFPGRNGLLAVQPVAGNGIVLVNASGRGAHRICTSSKLCGHPHDPSFAPDGRSLAFGGQSIGIVGLDGSCVDCQVGAGSHPAFLPGGTLLTFVSGGGVVEDSIDGLRRDTVLTAGNGAMGDVWSTAGKIAVVLHGHVWITRPKGLQALGPGHAPSWSPSGHQLVLVRNGWITIVNASGGNPRRLVQGDAPAFSPDGHQIAFIAPDHQLEVIPASGGTPRAVGHIRGVAVDWQPIPGHRAQPCRAPAGSKVLARSGQAVVTTDVGAAPSNGLLPDQAAMGCLLSDGHERLLERFTDNSIDGATAVTAAAVGGNYAAVVSRDTDQHYGGFTESTSVFDLRTGQPAGHGGETNQCAGGGPDPSCGGIDQVVVGSDGVSAVHIDAGPTASDGTDPLAALACASASLCIASDGFGQVDASSNPSASPWSAFQVAKLTGASCPSTSLCVGTAGGSIYTSSNPGGGAWASSALTGSPALGAISCASTSLCVATASGGQVAVSTNPTGGAAGWSLRHVDGSNTLEAITCPSTSECVATDAAGNILTSNNPGGGAGSWSAQAVAPGHAITSVSCPSATLCFALAPAATPSAAGVLWYSTAPNLGHWSQTTLPNSPSALACPSALLCVAVGVPGTIDESTAPTSGAWTSYAVSGAGGTLNQIACPTTSFCVGAGADAGDALVSTNPTQGSSAWNTVLADPITCPPATVCGTEKLEASDRNGIRTLDTSTEFEAQTGAQLTNLTLSGDTLSWQHAGSPQSAMLTP